MLPLSLTLTLVLSLFGADAQNEQVLSMRTVHFKHLDLEITEIKTLDPDTGLIIREAIGPDGSPVDFDALRMEEQRLKIQSRAKISPELGERIAASADSDVLQVAFWLREPEESDIRGIMDRAVVDGFHPEEARRMAFEEGTRIFAPGNNAFADLLQAEGHVVDYVGTGWPIVIATLPAARVQGIAAMNSVDQAYYAFPEWEHENNYAQPTLRTPTVHRRGNDGGAGAVKVMVQDSGGNVVKNNPYLPNVIWLTGTSTSSHATGVGGNVCMQKHIVYHGGAPGLDTLYSAEGWGDVDCPKAWDAGIKAGVSYGNCSWWNFNKGSIVFLDRFFDYIIRNYHVMMFKSNGNQGSSPPEYSTSPGNGYNMTCTGCYNDGDSFKWDDDFMASYSSFKNPVEGHEKPEVASPGDDVDTTGTSSPWIYYGFGGTSSASPLTMGVATLVANRDPAIIAHSQAIKAVLMVSAWHNVEGAPVISDKDGAGGVHAGAADAVARDGQYEVGTFTTNSFPYDKQIFCYQGDGTRVITLWQSDPDSAYVTDVLKMDLDMTVLDPSGGVVATSSSSLNPFELVYFKPAVTGTYKVRLSKQSFLGTTEPYCIAWSSRQDAATAEVILTGTGQIGTNMDFKFFDPFEYNEFFVALMSLSTLPSFIELGEGYILPVDFDALAYACYAGVFPGYVGTLNSSGEAGTSLFIPNAPGLIGTTIHTSMVIMDSSRLIPRDTSEVSSFTIN